MKRARFFHVSIALISIFSACPGSAQSVPNTGQPTVLSGTVTTQAAAGLSITVDSRWLDGPGYRPIRIAVASAAAVPADRDLLIRINTSRMYNPEPIMVTEQYLSIPSGTPAGQTIKTTVSIPPSMIWSDYSIEIIDPSTVKGTVFNQLNLKSMGNRMGNDGLDVIVSKYPHILFVGNTPPDTTAITALMPALAGYPTVPVRVYNNNTLQTAAFTGPNIPLPSEMALPMGDLPERWIDYSSLDIICLSIDQLADLANKNPAAYRAILDWTKAGGNLWICGVSTETSQWDRMAELEQLLRLTRAGNEKKGNDNAPDWTKPDFVVTESQKTDNSNPTPASPEEQTIFEGNQPPVNEPESKSVPPSSLKPFLLREYGMGTISAIATADPFSGDSKWSSSDWSVLNNMLGQGRWRWNLRHGMNLGQPSVDFWKFLIPGVGLAPVRTFQVFITLFVLGIGPFNYWLLRRQKRLHLMIFTVPLSAAVVTTLLFGYAVVADGLGTRLRVRSITRLDDRNGEAVTWARLSYYAGIAPSKGLTFSPQTAVYSIPDKDEFDYRSGGRKKMIWEDNQKLVRGWLDSRTPTQYLTVRSGKSSCRLKISDSSNENATLAVENRLGTPIGQLAICGHDGKYYFSENIGEGAKTQIKEATAELIESWLGKVSVENRLEFPPGIDPRDWNRASFINNRYSWYTRNLEEVSTDSSLLEVALERGRLEVNPIFRTAAFQSSALLLKPGTYVAIVPRLSEVELGTDSAREEAGFHVIVGEW